MSDLYLETDIDGLPVSGSMVSLEEADLYFKGRMNSDVWEDLIYNFSDEGDKTACYQAAFEKLKALTDATRRINNLNYLGCRTTSDQEHSFPRGGDLEVPRNIKYAVCELAYELLDDIDDNLENENLNVLSQSFSGVTTKHDRVSMDQHVQVGILSAIAWRYLTPFLPDPRTIRILKTS